MKSNFEALRTTYSTINNYKYLDLLGMFWVAALMVSTFAASKLVAFGPFVLPGTIIVYSITYILADIFTEVYGYKSTRRIIWSGIILLIFANVILYIISILPPAEGWEHQEAFATVFQTTPIFTLATILSYFSGEFTNSYTLAKMKVFTKGRWLWTRTIGSTTIAMLVDNAVYSLVAYSWSLPFRDLFSMVLMGWIFCVAYEALMTPVTYKIVGWLKKAEGVDIYDTNTDFNPFHIADKRA
jgi:queuosine precursor transporter